MDHAGLSPFGADEYRLNLARDGGRHVMFGGNPYEDDLEPADSPSPQSLPPEPSFGAEPSLF